MNTLLPKTLSPGALRGQLKRHPLAAAAVLGSLLLGACASTPVPSGELLQARSTVQSANLDRETQTHARLELKQANDTLQQANRMLDQGGDLAEINSAAYIAGRQAQTAMAIGQAKAADASIAGAELDRERVRGDMRTRQADRALALAESAKDQARRSLEQAAASDQRASAAEDRASGARRQVATARADAKVAQAEASDAQRQAAQLQQQLSDLQAKPTDRGMLVTFGDVLFESNRSDIKPGAQAGLHRLADFLRQYPQRRILIEGHTDSVGSAPFNEALSLRRASAVDDALVGMGVERQRVAIAGYGEDYPVADNGSVTNRAMNRRVEVYIGDAGEAVRTRR